MFYGATYDSIFVTLSISHQTAFLLFILRRQNGKRFLCSACILFYIKILFGIHKLLFKHYMKVRITDRMYVSGIETTV